MRFASPEDEERYGRNRVRRGRNGDADAERPLPHSVEAEEHLLSVCMIEESSADVVRRAREAGIRSESFYVAAHGTIFDAIVNLSDRQQPVAVHTVAEHLKGDHQLDAVGGFAFLSQVSGRQPTTAQAGFWIDKVRELALLRGVIRSAKATVEQAFNFTGNIEEFRTQAEERFLAATRSTVFAGKLPPVLSFSEFIGKTPRPLPPQLVAGMLDQGAKLMIAGGSKSFKTWVLLDLALSVATGTPWWGMKTQRGRVLYVNMEIMVGYCEDRVRSIMKAKHMDQAEDLDSWHLRGHARDLRELIPQFVKQASRGQYALIILDPIYKVLGERDENSNGEVAQLLNEVEALTVQTGAAVAYGHHFSKGNQSEKSALDRASGAGAWTRDPDALIAITPHEKDEHFAVEFTLRNHAPKNPFVVQWKFPCMEVAAGLDPAALRKPGAPKQHEVADILVLLMGRAMKYAEWEAAAAKAGISISTFKRLRKIASEQGSVIEAAGRYTLTTPSAAPASAVKGVQSEMGGIK